MLLKRLFSLFTLLVFTINSYAALPLMQGGDQAVSQIAVLPSFAPIVDKVMPAIVNISTTQNVKVGNPLDEMNIEIPEGGQFDLFREFMEREFGGEQRTRKAASLGSGFLIDPNGYIVTNYHVIADADEIKVTISNNPEKSIPAKVIGKDQRTDLALLKIDAPTPLPFLEFANSENSKVGDWVLAVGNPFGIGNTVTAGIISAKSRLIYGSYDEFIQIDASINRGNSGGPSLNLEGKVIGVNSVIISPSGGNVGIGLAVPSVLTQKVIEELKAKGLVERAWLGVKIQNVTEDIAKSINLAEAKGALVSDIVKDGPGSKAGIKTGDIIVKFDGKAVENSQRLPRIVGDTPIGKKVDIEVIRDNKTVVLTTTLTKLEDETEVGNPASAKGDAEASKDKTVLGMKVENLSNSIRQKFKIDKGITGVVVMKVNRSSAANDIGIRPGDVISLFNRVKVETTAELEKYIKEAVKKGAPNALLYVYRGGSGFFITISLEE